MADTVFSSKTEAYLILIHELEQLCASGRYSAANVERMEAVIAKIRIEIENHQQDADKVCRLLQLLKGHFRAEDVHDLNRLVLCIAADNYHDATAQERWVNSLGRRLESQMQLEFLRNPTDQMMAAVYKVSERMIKILEKRGVAGFSAKLNRGGAGAAFSFGAFEHQPNEAELIALLRSNRKDDLTRIMFVHFMMGRHVTRVLPKQFGALASDMEYWTDRVMYDSVYYSSRGRAGRFDRSVRAHRMGILVKDTDAAGHGLPETIGGGHACDAQAQVADYEASYTKGSLAADTPYVAGPSGMTSVLMGQMLAFDDCYKEEQKDYLNAVSAYIVGGGYHNLHEVVGPVAHCLASQGIVTGYNARACKRTPPNYHHYYQQAIDNDPQLVDRCHAAWSKMSRFMRDDYMPRRRASLAKTMAEPIVRRVVLTAIEKYKTKATGILKAKGRCRAAFYQTMMKQCKTRLQCQVILLALLKGGGVDLRKQIVAGLIQVGLVDADKTETTADVVKRLNDGLYATLAGMAVDHESKDKFGLDVARIKNVMKHIDREVVAPLARLAETWNYSSEAIDRGVSCLDRLVGGFDKLPGMCKPVLAAGRDDRVSNSYRVAV